MNRSARGNAQTATPSEQPKLLRALGPSTATAVVVGSVIGSGIFLKPGNIAADCGSFPLIIGVWIVGGVLCVLGALCFCELATMLPHAGGLYVYLRQAYGRLIAFLFGWTELFFVRPASTGALAVAFVGSFTLAIDWDISALGRFLLAGLLILVMAIINIAGVVWGGRVQVITTIIKVAFLVLLALAPFLAFPWLGWSVRLANYASTSEPHQLTLAGQIGAVLLSVMWAYNGWESITPLAEEVRDPNRNIPLALFGGIGILMLLYLAANIAYHGVLTMDEMKAAGDHAAELMLYRLAGPPGQVAMSVVIMCSTFGAINTNLLYAPRIPFAMGRDRVFFSALGRVHPDFRTPVLAIATTSLMAILLVATVTVGKLLARDVDAAQVGWELGRRIVESLHDNSTFDLLTNFVIFAGSVFYMLAVVALIVLRIQHPEWNRPYRTWGYPYVPLLFFVSYAWFLVQVYRGSPLESRTGVGLILLGVPVYFLFQWRKTDDAA